MKTTYFNIAILDDSDFYNHLITKQISSYAEALSTYHNAVITIESFTDHLKFKKYLQANLDVVILDYYLGGGYTALDMLHEIENASPDCQVLVLSQQRNMFTAHRTITEGASQFIHKSDKYALPKACFFIENQLSKKTRA